MRKKNILIIICTILTSVLYPQTKTGTGWELNSSTSTLNKIRWERTLETQNIKQGKAFVTRYYFKLENKGSFEIVIYHLKQPKKLIYSLFAISYDTEDPFILSIVDLNKIEKSDSVYSIPAKETEIDLDKLDFVFLSKKQEHIKITSIYCTRIFEFFVTLEQY